MARVICPPRCELQLLRTPLTAGELRVLDFFDQYMPDGWEIYIQPHLNGLRPDFVLLHPHAGIAVFEVKDWSLDAMTYFVRQEAGSVSLWFRDAGGKAYLVGPESDFEAFRIPDTAPAVRPVLEMLPVQLVSLALAALAGLEPGNFKLLTKVTTIE